MSDQLDIIESIEQDEREFWEALGKPEPSKRSELDVRLDWLLERIAKRRALIAENDAVAEARKLQIEDWRQGENAKLERAITWFSYQIRELVPADADSFREQYGKKSRQLPFGVIGFNKRPDKVEIFDADKALEWARARNLPITVKESVSKTTLKEAMEKAGINEGDGFAIAPGMDEFYVRTDETERKGH